MEMSPSFLMTSAGSMPADWDLKAAEDIVEPSAPICYGVVQVGQNVENGIPIVAIKYVKDIANSPLHRTANHLEAPYSKSRLKSGDVLISIKGTIGRVGVVPDGFSGNISRELARLRIRQDIDPLYVAYQLESPATQDRIMRAVVGTTRLEFSIASLRQFQIPIPRSFDEQRNIALTLAEVDKIIDELTLLINKKYQIKHAIAPDLVSGKKRLAGFDGNWSLKELRELAMLSKGSQLNISAVGSGELPYLNGGINPSGYTNKFNTQAMTIAISEGGNSCGFVQFMTTPYWCGGHCYSVIPRGINNKFLYQALKMRQPEIMALRVGSGLPNIQKSALNSFLIHEPSDQNEQAAIAQVLSDMDEEISALESQLHKTKLMKLGMMQVLLTGRTRLV